MKRSHASLVFKLCATASFAAAAATAAHAHAHAHAAAQKYHVIEVHLQPVGETAAKALLRVLTEKLGAPKEKAHALLEKLKQSGKAIMVAGSEGPCKESAKMFVDIGMKAVVRPLKDHMHGAKNWVQLYTAH